MIMLILRIGGSVVVEIAGPLLRVVLVMIIEDAEALVAHVALEALVIVNETIAHDVAIAVLRIA